MPPAPFGAAHFHAWMRIDGDRGARDPIRAARLVPAGPGELTDGDPPDDLERPAARRDRSQLES
ncbi:MAG: hypothetical protein ACOY45_15275 [Pseudomonadota bacterium]